MESTRADVGKRPESGYNSWLGILNRGIKTGEFRDDIDPEMIAPILDAAVDGLSLH